MQANYKISAMRILYELHSLKQRRAYMIIRAEIEEKHRQRVETEVSCAGTEILLLVTLNCGNITKHSASVGQCYSPTLLRPNDTGTLSNILANIF